jgi:branched-chain amino acid transport system ATP-binding protein
MSACDRILVMHHGESLMVGSPAEVKNDKRVEAAYLGDVDGLA